MAIYITGVRYNNDFRPSQDLDYLQGAIDEPISVEIDFNYQDIVYSTEFDLIYLEPARSIIDLQDPTGIVYSENATAFEEYYVGDSICLRTGAGVFQYVEVTEKINAQTIRTTYASGTATLTIDEDYVFNCTPFGGLRYLYNLVEQGGSFNSLIDGEEQKLQISTLDADNLVPQNMVFSGAKSYQIGSATIVGNGGAGGKAGAVNGEYEKQLFTIVHTFAITPTFLPNQYTDFIAGKAPSYFIAQKCLNYIAELSLGRSLNNPNGLQTVTANTNQSSTGFYNENFNGNPTNYSIKSLTMLDGATPVSQLRFGKDITVEIVVENTVDSPFSNTNTQYMFGFNYLPSSDTLTQKNGYNQTRNFARDYLLNTLGSGSQNGANFGTNLQIIKTVTSTFISATEMKVTAVINTGTDADAILQQDTFSRYKLWLITEDHTTTDENSDRINLIVDKNAFDYELTNTDLVESTGITFIQHPYIDAVDATAGASIELFPVDDIVANMPFHIDFTGIDASEEVKINNVQSKVLLKDSAALEADVLLEDFRVNTASFPIVGGQAQSINYSQDRPFKIPSGEIRKVISLVRDYASDSGNDLYYNFQYPFFIRWEYWVALLNVSPIPSDLYDPNLPSDGLNHFWQRLANITTWDIVYEVTFTIEQNGVSFTQTFEQSLKDAFNFEGNTNWENHTIDSYTYPGGVAIASGGNKYVRGYEDVEIRAQAEKTTGPLPAILNMVMVLWIEVFEEGGTDDVRRISSLYPLSSQSWFKSIAPGGLTQVTNPSVGVYRATALLDYTKLPPNLDFTVYARFYEFFNPNAKQFENNIGGGDDFEFENNIGGGELYEFEDNIGGGGGLTIGIGTAFKQKFLQQTSTSDLPTSRPATDPALLPPEVCCFEIPVFAEIVVTSDFNNDKRSFSEFFNNNFTGATMKLQKFVGGVWTDPANLVDDTYGTYYAYDFNDATENIYGESMIGYLIEWQKVLSLHNTGTYRVMFTGTIIGGATQERPSNAFCLKKYDPFEIDNTVRIEYWTSGNIGDIRSDKAKRDYQTLNWYNQLRLPNSAFGFDKSDLEDKYTKYQNGNVVYLQKEKVKEYILKCGLIPYPFHLVLEIDVSLATAIQITDYNESNPTKHTQTDVNVSSGYEPDYAMGTLYAPVEMKFKQATQNLNAKRC